jgi:hypothetical protein
VDGGSTTAMVGNTGCMSEAARVHDCHSVLATVFVTCGADRVTIKHTLTECTIARMFWQ